MDRVVPVKSASKKIQHPARKHNISSGNDYGCSCYWRHWRTASVITVTSWPLSGRRLANQGSPALLYHLPSRRANQPDQARDEKWRLSNRRPARTDV